MTNPRQLAEAYSAEVFTLNPDGFTVAPYVNAHTMSEAFDAGFHAALSSSEVAGMREALGRAAEEFCIKPRCQCSTAQALAAFDRLAKGGE